jgi:hypothetical protein
MTWISNGTSLCPTKTTDTGTPSLFRAEAAAGSLEEQAAKKEPSNANKMPTIWFMRALPDFVDGMMCYPQYCRTEKINAALSFPQAGNP